MSSIVNYFCIYGSTQDEYGVDQQFPDEVKKRQKWAIAKITGIVAGLLLIAMAVGLHFNNVNVTTVASLGAVGGFIMVCALAVSYLQFRDVRGHTKQLRLQKEEIAINELRRQLIAWTEEGKIEEIRNALSGHSTIPPTRYNDRFDGLAKAAWHGHVELVRLYLEKREDPLNSFMDLPVVRGGNAFQSALASPAPNSLECMKIICAHTPLVLSVKNTKIIAFLTEHKIFLTGGSSFLLLY